MRMTYCMAAYKAKAEDIGLCSESKDVYERVRSNILLLSFQAQGWTVELVVRSILAI